MAHTAPAPVANLDKQLVAYERDGYFVIPRLFAADEIDIPKAIAERDLPSSRVLTKQDQDGNKISLKTSLKMWNRTSNDIYGLFSRNERIVEWSSMCWVLRSISTARRGSSKRGEKAAHRSGTRTTGTGMRTSALRRR